MRRHCAGIAIAEGTLMRHSLFCMARARTPSALPGRMLDRAMTACLVTRGGALARVMPPHRGAVPGAVNLTPITAAADMHLLATPGAHIQAMRFGGLRHARCFQTGTGQRHAKRA
jgi:hypothetical protein